jgi:hypothetical protein
MPRGGKRAGAGRKKGSLDKVRLLKLDGPERDLVGDYLLGMVQNRKYRHRLRLEAARILMPYLFRKMPEGREHSGPNGAPLALVVDTHLVAGTGQKTPLAAAGGTSHP